MSEKENELSNTAILELELKLETSDNLVIELYGQLGETQQALITASDRVRELETECDSAPPLAASDVVRAQAATFRTAQRNGHPDAAKHMEKLLSMLGAV